MTGKNGESIKERHKRKPLEGNQKWKIKIYLDQQKHFSHYNKEKYER